MKPFIIISVIIISLNLAFYIILLIIYKIAFYNDNKHKQQLMINFKNPQYQAHKDYMIRLKEKAKNLTFDMNSLSMALWTNI